MQTLKRVTSCLLFFILSVNAFSQKKDTLTGYQKNNIIKINLSALVFKNFSFQYERKISRSTTVGVNVHYMPFSKLPFLSSIEKAVDDPDVPVDLIKLGSTGITPEIRFYVGKKGAFHGFYIAPYANYTNYKTDLPIDYDTKTGIFNGNVKAITGGILFGAQWNLSKTVYLDWWIIGPAYGSGKGNLDLNTTLSPTEQTDLRDQIEDLRADAPFDKIIESYTVDANGARIRASGPWAGLRGLGFNIGIRF
ncbi:MAG: DUF3575 domain-containing protein [Ferruginibacter sp.]